VPGAEHADYDGATLAPTYVLDTRGDGMISFLNRVTESVDDGVPPGIEAPAASSPPLTPREREVAELLAQGQTNAEIASALYMSVAAVKKHVNAMLHKYGLKNRTQLAQALPAFHPAYRAEGRRQTASPFSSDA
jgi:DNA-binding CsgD family transcriptional regulator